MPNITLSLPEKLYRKMKMYPEIKWSVVIKKYVEEYIRKLGYKEEVKTDGYLKGVKVFEKGVRGNK